MITLGTSLDNKPVLSLRTGMPIGRTISPLIDPNNLKIIGWHAEDRFSKSQGILLSQDVRDFLPQGLIVDDHDAITDPSELVRLKDLLNLEFKLIGMPVVTENSKKLGKVSDFSFEKNGFFVQKIYVARSVFKSLVTDSLIIDRSQIVEITLQHIVVKDSVITEKVKSPAKSGVITPQFAN